MRAAILWFLFLAAWPLWGQTCQERVEKLAHLQNELVAKTLFALKPGTWAEYDNGVRLLYVGQSRQGRQTLYGVELQSPKGIWQLWVAPLRKSFQSGRFTTLVPKLLYLRVGEQVFRLLPEQLTMLALLTNYDPRRLLALGEGLLPSSCDRTALTRRTEKGNFLVAYKGVRMLLSRTVPFALIKAIDADGSTLALKRFGKKGAALIDETMRQNATAFTMSFGFLQP